MCCLKGGGVAWACISCHASVERITIRAEVDNKRFLLRTLSLVLTSDNLSSLTFLQLTNVDPLPVVYRIMDLLRGIRCVLMKLLSVTLIKTWRNDSGYLVKKVDLDYDTHIKCIIFEGGNIMTDIFQHIFTICIYCLKDLGSNEIKVQYWQVGLNILHYQKLKYRYVFYSIESTAMCTLKCKPRFHPHPNVYYTDFLRVSDHILDDGPNSLISKVKLCYV